MVLTLRPAPPSWPTTVPRPSRCLVRTNWSTTPCWPESEHWPTTPGKRPGPTLSGGWKQRKASRWTLDGGPPFRARPRPGGHCGKGPKRGSRNDPASGFRLLFGNRRHTRGSGHRPEPNPGANLWGLSGGRKNTCSSLFVSAAPTLRKQVTFSPPTSGRWECCRAITPGPWRLLIRVCNCPAGAGLHPGDGHDGPSRPGGPLSSASLPGPEKSLRAIELASLVDDPYSEILGRSVATGCSLVLGDLEGARGHAAAMLPLAERLGQRGESARAFWWNAELSRLEGDWLRAFEHSDHGLVAAPGIRTSWAPERHWNARWAKKPNARLIKSYSSRSGSRQDNSYQLHSTLHCFDYSRNIPHNRCLRPLGKCSDSRRGGAINPIRYPS